MAIGALLGTALPASADTGTDGFTILYAKDGGTAHQCTVLKTSSGATTVDGYQGVVCADIVTGVTSTGYYAYGRIEGYCQTTSGVTVQCAEAHLEGSISDAADVDADVIDWECGRALGACSTGRNIRSTSKLNYSVGYPACKSDPDGSTAVWTVVLERRTRIDLPGSDTEVSLDHAGNDDENESTGHFYVCY